MRKIVWTIIVLIVIALLAWFGFSKTGGNATTSGPIKIGAISALTGDWVTGGQNVKAAIEIAVEKINQNGGINGRSIQVVYEDGKCNGKDAATAASKLVNVDKVVAIVGGTCSSESLGAAPIAEQGKVVMISPVSSNPSLTQAGDYFFRDYPSDSYQGQVAADFAINNLKAKRIAIFSCLNDWCSAISKVFAQQVVADKGQIVANEQFDENAKDLRGQIAKIKNTRPDLVYYLSYVNGAVSGLQQMKELGVSVPKLGGDAWCDPQIIKLAGSASDGIMCIMPSAYQNLDFQNAMKAKTNSDEITPGAPQAYDAVNILAGVMKQVGTDSSKIKDALYKVSNYQGISGVITFDQNGDMVNATYDIKQAKDGKFVKIN